MRAKWLRVSGLALSMAMAITMKPVLCFAEENENTEELATELDATEVIENVDEIPVELEIIENEEVNVFLPSPAPKMEKVSAVDLVGLVTPVDRVLPNTGISASGNKLTASNVRWNRVDDKGKFHNIGNGETFFARNRYAVSVYISPKQGYSLDSKRLSVLVNGVSDSGWSISYDYCGGATLTKIFDVTAPVVDPEEPDNPGEEDVNPEEPDNPGEEDVNPEEPDNPGEEDVNPEEPDNPGEEDVNPEEPDNPGEEDVNPEEPDNPGEEDVNPDDSDNANEPQDTVIGTAIEEPYGAITPVVRGVSVPPAFIVAPEQPASIVSPATASNESSSNIHAIQTGDASPIVVVFAAMICTLGGIVLLKFKKKKL